jgi:hypothetical protein
MKEKGGNRDLRTRTKEYASRIIRRDGVADTLGNNCCDPELQSPHIIERRVAPNLISTSSASSKARSKN